MFHKIFFDIWYKNSYRFLLIFLFPLSAIYYLIISLRNIAYDLFKISKKVDSKVISIGNINLGGTGKTPFLLFLLTLAENKYKKILVLTRGYGGKLDGEIFDIDGYSDESRLIKNKFPNIIIWAGKNRLESYERFKKKYGVPDLVLLDDGFQHRKMERDLDIVMINGRLLFGNGFVFPAGPLREPVSSIKKRADVIVLKDGNDEVYGFLKKMFPHKNIINFVLKRKYFTNFVGDKIYKDFLLNKKITAFCSIADPYSFFKTLEEEGLKIENKFIFADHYNYKKEDIDKLLKVNSEVFITTEKDFVKLKLLWKESNKLFILVNEYDIDNINFDI